MTTGLVLRLADDEDAALVGAVSARAYLPAYQAVIGQAPQPALEDYGDKIRLRNVWLAEIGGQPCAVLVLAPAADHLMVYSIAVLPERQGAGIGKALLAFAESRGRAAGAPELRLYTNQRMRRNLGIYRSAGFVELGTRPHPSRLGEVLVDMVKSLRG